MILFPLQDKLLPEQMWFVSQQEEVPFFGCKPVPSLKLATNSPMYNRMIEDMDLNCGEIIDGTMDVQEMGSIIFQKILATASGELTKSEEFGFGDYEFAPWKIGAVL